MFVFMTSSDQHITHLICIDASGSSDADGNKLCNYGSTDDDKGRKPELDNLLAEHYAFRDAPAIHQEGNEEEIDDETTIEVAERFGRNTF